MNASFLLFISLSDALKIHEMVISRFGGKQGVLDQRLLESAIHHPLMIIEFGEEKDCTISHLAAAYFFHIIKKSSLS